MIINDLLQHREFLMLSTKLKNVGAAGQSFLKILYYFPNSFDTIQPDPKYKEPAQNLESSVADWYDRNVSGEDDHYTQPGNLFRLMTPDAQENTIENIVNAMNGISGPKRDEIINRQLCHWFRADLNLGVGIAKGLNVNLDKAMQHNPA